MSIIKLLQLKQCKNLSLEFFFLKNKRFEFPLEIENAILTGLTIEIEEKKIIAKVKEKEKARDTYDDAISSGKGAYLVEEAKGNVFTIKVGSLPPKKKVTGNFVYFNLRFKKKNIRYLIF